MSDSPRCDVPFVFGDLTLPNVRCERKVGHRGWHRHYDDEATCRMRVDWKMSSAPSIAQKIADVEMSMDAIPVRACGTCGHALRRHNAMEGMCLDCSCDGWSPWHEQET